MALNFLAIAITFRLASSLSALSLDVGKCFLTGFSGLFVFWNWPSILFTWISSRLSPLRNVSIAGGEESSTSKLAEGGSTELSCELR